MPTYDDAKALASATEELRRCPPLIFAGEVRRYALFSTCLLKSSGGSWLGSHDQRGRGGEAVCLLAPVGGEGPLV